MLKPLKKMKSGKYSGLDGVVVEVESDFGKRLKRLLTLCLENGKVRKDWVVSCIVHGYKENENKSECTSSREISLGK